MRNKDKLPIQGQRLISRYLVQQSSFFGFTTQKLLSIFGESLLIQDLEESSPPLQLLQLCELPALILNYDNSQEISLVEQGGSCTSFRCAEGSQLFADYLLAADNYVLNQMNDLGQQEALLAQVPGQSLAVGKEGLTMDSLLYVVEAKLLANNFDLELNYQVSFVVLRGWVRISLLNTYNSIMTLSHKLVGYQRTGHCLEICYLDIKEVMLELYGFRIVLKHSERSLTFLVEDPKIKNTLVDMMKSNAVNFMNTDIRTTVADTTSSLAGRKISKESEQNFNCRFEGLSCTIFGDLVDVELYLNNLHIYEVHKGVINQRLRIPDIKDIIRPAGGLPRLQILYNGGDLHTFYFRREDLELATSNLFHLLTFSKRPSEEVMASQVPFSNLRVFKTLWSHLPPRNLRIRGMEHSPSRDKEMLGRTSEMVTFPKEFISEVDCLLESSIFKGDLDLNDEVDLICSEFIENEKNLLSNLNQESAKVLFEFHNSILQNLLIKTFYSGILESPIEDNLHFFPKYSRDLESRELEMQHKLDYLSSQAREYELFLFSEELQHRVDYLCTLLHLFSVLTGNKQFYRSFAIKVNIESNKGHRTAKKFIASLHNLAVQTALPLLAQAACNLLDKLTLYPLDDSEQRAESLNRNLLVSSKCNITFLNDVFRLLGKSFLCCSQDRFGSQVKLQALQTTGLLQILVNVLYERKESSTAEDFYLVLKHTSSTLAFAVFCALCNGEAQQVVYLVSLLMMSVLQSSPTRHKIVEYQMMVLNHSTLLLKHMEIMMTPFAKRQKQLSEKVLYDTLVENRVGCALVQRLMPRSLFKHVDSTSNDVAKWTLSQWGKLFNLMNTEFNSAVEQWNDSCRQELISFMVETQDLLEARRTPLTLELLEAAIEMGSKQTEEEAVRNSLLQLRWNHEEVEMRYETLYAKLPVWKYYLTELFSEGEAPSLRWRVDHPRHLWEELTIRYISSILYLEKKRILETMVLLYQVYADSIKQMTFIPYLLKVLDNPQDSEYHYLILQLLFTGLTVETESLKAQNLSRFHENGGLSVLRLHIMRSYFFEDLSLLDYEALRASVMDSCSEVTDFDVVYNYSPATLVREAYNAPLQAANRVILCLLIKKQCLQQSKSQSEELMLFPRPLARTIIMEQETINVVHQVVLLKDRYVRIAAHELVRYAYLDKFSLADFLRNSGFYERVILLLEPTSAELALNNLRKIFFTLQEIFPELRPTFEFFQVFGTFERSQELAMEEDEQPKSLEQVYPLFRLLPPPLVHVLIKNGIKEFCKIFFSEYHQSPKLIWSQKMRQELLSQLQDVLKIQARSLQTGLSKEKEIRKQGFSLKLMTSQKNRLFRLEKPSIFFIKYKQIEHELKAGPLYLRVWIQKQHAHEEIAAMSRKQIVEDLFSLLTTRSNELQVSSDLVTAVWHLPTVQALCTLLKAHVRMLALFEVDYSACLGSLAFLLETWNNLIHLSVPFCSKEQPLRETKVVRMLWDSTVLAIFEVLRLCLRNRQTDVLQEIRAKKLLKSHILLAGTKILGLSLDHKFLSFIGLDSLKSLSGFLREVQNTEINIVEFFQDSSPEVKDYFSIGQLLTTLLEPFSLYFGLISKNKFVAIKASHRSNGIIKDDDSENESVDQSRPASSVDYDLLDCVQQSQQGGNLADILDPLESNMYTFLDRHHYPNLLMGKTENILLEMTSNVVESIDLLSEVHTTAHRLLEGGIGHRLLFSSVQFIPKKIRYLKEMQDVVYEVREKLSRINALAFVGLSNLLAVAFQASANHGVSNLESDLTELTPGQIESLKDASKTLPVQEAKMLEVFIVDLIESIGGKLVSELMKVKFQKAHLYNIRDLVIEGMGPVSVLETPISNGVKSVPVVESKPLEKPSRFQLQQQQSQKALSTSKGPIREYNIPESFLKNAEKTLKSKLCIGRVDPNDLNASDKWDKKTFHHQNTMNFLEVDVQVMGVPLANYVKNPIELEAPASFLDEATSKLATYQSVSMPALTLILRACICVMRDSPHLNLKQSTIQRLIDLYNGVDPSWTGVQAKICDFFIAACIIFRNENRTIDWIRWNSFRDLLISVFLGMADSKTKEGQQLIVKWNLILNQIVKTGDGNEAFKSSKLYYGLYRVVFDRTLPSSLRKNFCSLILDLGSTACPLDHFMRRLAKVSLPDKDFGELDAEQIVELVQKDTLHPEIAFSQKVSRMVIQGLEDRLRALQTVDVAQEDGELDKKDLQFLELSAIKGEKVFQKVGLKLLLRVQTSAKLFISYAHLLPNLLERSNFILQELVEQKDMRTDSILEQVELLCAQLSVSLALFKAHEPLQNSSGNRKGQLTVSQLEQLREQVAKVLNHCWNPLYQVILHSDQLQVLKLLSLQLYLQYSSCKMGDKSSKSEEQLPEMMARVIQEVLMDFQMFTTNIQSSMYRSQYTRSRRSISINRNGDFGIRLLLVQVVTLILVKSPAVAKLINFEDLINLVEKLTLEHPKASWISIFVNILAVLQNQGFLNKVIQNLLKKRLGSIYLQILSVEVDQVKSQYWRKDFDRVDPTTIMSSIPKGQPPLKLPIWPDSVIEIEIQAPLLSEKERKSKFLGKVKN